MAIKNMTNEFLITSYIKAFRLNLNNDFLKLLYVEIDNRNIKHLLPKECQEHTISIL
jgi:hypothetical protein